MAATTRRSKKPCKRCGGHLRYAANYGCVACARSRIKERYKADPAFRARLLRYARNRAAVDPAGALLRSAKYRARNKGLPFALTLGDITIPARCPVLGTELVLLRAGASDAANAPSLDRLVPELGYVPGNVIVVSWKANRIRNDHDAKDLMRVGFFYARLLQN